jgi:hypothetical protein
MAATADRKRAALAAAAEPGLTAPPPDVAPPSLPAVIAGPTATFWGALSALRGKRIFHPHGIAYDAELVVHGDRPPTGAPILDEAGRLPAIVRCSRGAGLPEGLPDTLGIAIRLCDVHGPGLHQDFLLNASADLPVLQNLILPAWDGFFGQSFSSVLPYRIGGNLRLVGALPAAAERRRGRGSMPELQELVARGEAAWDLALAAEGGRWQRPFARLYLGRELSPELAEDLRFNPWHTGGGIRPAGPLQGLRQAAYKGSQAGRDAPRA